MSLTNRDYEGMQDFLTAVGRGQVPWATPFSAYGRYVATGGEVNHILWPDGIFNIPAPTGVQMSFVSTGVNAAQDSAAGTGARTIHVHYLDANLNPQTETIALNGATPVLSAATNIRFIQCIHILTAGSGKAFAGTLVVSNGGVTYSQVEAGARRCASSARMVPAGKKLYVIGANGGSISGTAAAGAQIKISSTWFEDVDLTTGLIFMPFGSIGLQDTTVAYTFPMPAGPFPAGTIVAMELSVDKAATLTGDWFGWLENA